MLHRIGVVDAHAGVAGGEERHGGAISIGGDELVGDRGDAGGVKHGAPLRCRGLW
jgi:hypothetical protein